MKIALSIGGSDSGAGAGIQSDIKTFSALGTYSCTVITAITAQNTKTVSEIFEVSPEIVEQQIRSVMIDMPPSTIKIGMVYSKEIIDAVHHSLKQSTKIPIVLDPILVASTGKKLLRDDALDSFKSKLIPQCTLITPNRTEAEKISGRKIRTENEVIHAAKKIKGLGARSVIIKGGHFDAATVTDILLDSQGKLTRFCRPKIKIKDTHGSGCNFSAAVTAYLVKGAVLQEACRMANDYVHTAIKTTIKVGRGLRVTNPLSEIYRDAMRYRVTAELQSCVQKFCGLYGVYRLIPETQTNFVYALQEAANTSEVAAVRGRIVRIGNSAVPASYVEFGASTHMASAVIACMSITPAFRSAVNIRYDEDLVRICKSLFSVSSYDRSVEPNVVKKIEGSTISWGTVQALSKNPKAEVIYHSGDIGKEPMIMIFGRCPSNVLAKVKLILKKL